MNKSSSARRIPPGSAGTVPITRRRQSLTVYEPAGSGRTPPSISLQCSVEEWNGTDGSTGMMEDGMGLNNTIFFRRYYNIHWAIFTRCGQLNFYSFKQNKEANA